MRRRRVFTVEVNYDMQHDLEGNKYQRRRGIGPINPDEEVTVEELTALLVAAPDGWGWFASVEVSEKQ